MNSVEFISGVYMATFAASGVFFLKFYRASRDVFFLYFCLACWLLSIERVALLFVEGGYAATPTPSGGEARSFVHIIRMIAFTLILLAVVKKNRGTPRP